MGCASKPSATKDDALSSQTEQSDIDKNRDFDYVEEEGSREIGQNPGNHDATIPDAEILEGHGPVTQLGDERVSNSLFNFVEGEGASSAFNASAGGMDKGEFVVVEANPVLKNIYFDFDQYKLSKKMQALLVRHGQWLKAHPESDVLVEGYCDARGSREYNMVLGERRALAVKRFLWKQGVKREQVSIISYGKERPSCIVDTEACHYKNRRAQFRLQ